MWTDRKSHRRDAENAEVAQRKATQNSLCNLRVLCVSAVKQRRGGALLAVLWLSAALAAIALSVATSVRGETERTSAAEEGLRARYLAAGAVERAALWMEWAPSYFGPDGRSLYYNRDTPVLRFEFPEGSAVVEIIPESSKLDVNRATGEELFRLLSALQAGPARAAEITEAILDWRANRDPEAPPTVFDQFYLASKPSFRARHASFEEIEELLLVKGMTPELFYGAYERDSERRLAPRAGLRDCVTVSGGWQIDANTAEPAVLVAIGLSPEVATLVAQTRRIAPFRSPDQILSVTGGSPAASRLGIGGNSMFTLRATASVRRQDGSLSPDRRSVAAVVKFGRRATDARFTVVRWNENVWAR